MQRSPYWPLNGPPFFRYRDSESRCSHCTKADVGIGPKLSGTDGIPTNKGFEETRRKLRRPTIRCESVILVTYKSDFGRYLAAGTDGLFRVPCGLEQSREPLSLRG